MPLDQTDLWNEQETRDHSVKPIDTPLAKEKSHTTSPADQIRLTEQRLSVALSGAGAGAWETDLETGENTWDQGVAELIGIPIGQEGVEGKRWTEYIHPEDREAVTASFRFAGDKGLPWSEDFRVVRADGVIRWFNSRGVAVTLQDGCRKMVGVVQDITERKRTEEALRESEARLRNIARAGRIGFVEWNSDKDISYWNPEHYELFGFEPDLPVPYKQWLEGVHPEDRDRVVKNAARLLERGRTEGHVRDHKDEYRFIRPDGSMIWIGALMSAEVVAGELIVRGSVHDITERKQSEVALASVHQQIQSIINNMPAIVYAFDLEERFVMANAAVAELFHSTPEQILGKRRHAFMPKADADWHEANDRKVIEAGQALEFEEHSELPGRSITWLTTKFPLHDAQGRIFAVAGISKDISERKKAEEELRQAREVARQRLVELEDLYRNAPVGLCVLDRDLRWVRINERLAEINGIPAEAHIGKRVHDLLPELAETVEPEMRRVLETGQPRLNIEIVSETPAQPGVKRSWLQQWLPLADADGRVTGLSIVVEEISERKQAQEALVQLNETLEEKVQERTAMAETRASQLRSLAVELIETEERERRQFAHLLHEDLQQLLAAAKMQVHAVAADSSHEPVMSDIASILEEAIAKSRQLSHELSPPVLHQAGLISALQWLSRHMHEKFGLDIELEVNTELLLERTPQKVFLFRAVQELLFNTVKHAGVKSVKVEVSSTEDSIIVTVSDQGCGFNPEVLSQRGVKLGFGLLTIKERASYIEGKFTIESAPGQGSRFTLTVPNAAANGLGEMATDEQVVEEVKLPHAKAMKSTAKGISVLFVDDHKVMRQGLMKLVSGMPAIRIAGEASNGREALEQACKLSPDVILMDISMPEMDGIETTRCIKAKLPKVRVIGLTMHHDEHLIEAMKKAGAEVTLSKTTSASELIKTILVGTTSCD
jgi:PAS domain S-box-containing protein